MSNSTQVFDGAKMLGALQSANPVMIESSSGVLSLTAESNSFIAGGIEAINSIVGGTEVTQGIYVITWDTVRTMVNSAALQLIGKADRVTAVGDVGVYQLSGGVVAELSYMPIGGYAKDAFSNVLVGGTTIAADSPNATLELAAGTNIALNPDAGNKKVTVSVTAIIPPGAVQYFAMKTAPIGWLVANGSAFSRAQYSALFDAIGTTYGSGDGSTTFNLPDLRGEFIRGYDNGRGVDSGRVFGSWQRASGIPDWSGNLINPTRIAATIDEPDSVDPYTLDYHDDVTAEAGGFTGYYQRVRPRNVALLACIKY